MVKKSSPPWYLTMYPEGTQEAESAEDMPEWESIVDDDRDTGDEEAEEEMEVE